MKMLMVIGPENRQEALRKLIAEHEVSAYSELPHVFGQGTTGKRFGTDIWPESSALIFTVVEDAKMDELLGALRAFRRGLYPTEGLRAFVVPVETAI